MHMPETNQRPHVAPALYASADRRGDHGGWEPSIRRKLAATAVALLIAAPLPVFAEWSLGQLMHSLSQNKSGRATFVEKKFLALLDKPVESSGELYFTAPDRLEKRTLQPKPEALVLDQGRLLIEQGKRRYQLSLQDYPEIAAFVESIRGTLAGDREALERVYRIELEGNSDRWQLVLQPREEKMRAVVSRIRIGGARNDVQTIEIRQADGDRSIMSISRVDNP